MIYFLICTLLSVSGSAQIIIRTSSRGIIVGNNIEHEYEIELNEKFGRPQYLFAVKPEFATQVFSLDSMFNYENKVALYPVNPLDEDKVKKNIVFSGFLDNTDKLKSTQRVGTYPTAPISYTTNTDLTTYEFREIISEKLNRYHFIVVDRITDVFDLYKGSDFALAGEVIYYEKKTKGTPGFVISLVVRWTLLDTRTRENVLKFLTGGFCSKRVKISNKELQDFVYSAGILPESTHGTNVTVVLPKVKAMASDQNYIEKAIQSAVTIQSSSGHGSGFLISADGYILTNYHVIKDSMGLQVIFSNDLTLPLKIVSNDAKVDVALCKAPGKGYKPMPLDTTPVKRKIGSDVIAIGTPEDIQFGQTVTKGIVSAIREIGGNIFLQTDVSINSGNSGGMLNNKDGEVIGIVCSKIKKEGTEGMGLQFLSHRQ